MKLEVNLTDSFNYTKLLFNDLGRLLLLIILDIIPIVNFIVVGYLANVIKQPKDSNKLPPLENYFDLWIQGLVVVVASVIFMIIPIILIVPFVFVYVVSSWFYFPVLSTIGGFLAIILLIIGIVFAFFLGLLLAMAIINMVKQDSFSKVFAFSEIMEIIGKIGWGNYIVWLVIIFIGAIIVSAIGGIPVIGWFLGTIIAPIFGVFVARSATLTYMEATPEEPPTTIEET
jgi:hypothetical protein